MPHIAISMIPGRNRDEKQALAKKVQDFICTELNLEKQFVTVSVEEILRENWNEHMKNFKEKEVFYQEG